MKLVGKAAGTIVLVKANLALIFTKINFITS